MPIETNLNQSPYFDDYDPEKDYYKILFRPGLPVQVRELNQIQSMTQAQIERLGDHLFKRGTILDGCNFTFHYNYPYVKLNDVETNGAPLNVNSLDHMFVRNSSNLVSYVVGVSSGFESKNPDLNTIYLRYQNAGDDGNTYTYANGEALTVYDANNSIYGVTVNAGAANFSNSDVVVFSSAIGVVNSTGGIDLGGTFTPGEVINQGTTNARAVILESNTTANGQLVVLKIRPLTNDLSSSNTNADAAWTFGTGLSVIGNTSGTSANVVSIIGDAAQAGIVTDGIGKVIQVAMINRGQGYYVAPHATIRSTTGTINDLNIVARNYVAIARVANVANSTGAGYAFSVSDGTIYQKGYNLRVSPQTVIVSKYTNKPDQLVAGFDTLEQIINSSADTSLLDQGMRNAPGANRLKLTPQLVVLSKTQSEANDQFFSIVEWSEGRPFKQNAKTVYNTLGDEMARRTAEESGNFVLDRFYVNTKSPVNFADEASKLNVVVDPGVAYIDGYRVQSVSNYSKLIDKAILTKTNADSSISINYGNYIFVTGLGGQIPFNAAPSINLHKEVISSTGVAPAQSHIGDAKVRNVVFESGEPGSVDAVYRLYLFDIKMQPGFNFRDVKGLRFSNPNGVGWANAKLTLDPTLNKNILKLNETSNSSLLFSVGHQAVKSITNLNYEYRNLNQSPVANTGGQFSITLASPQEFFPYIGGLSRQEKEDIIVIPKSDARGTQIGTVNVYSGNNLLTGGNVSVLQVGDYFHMTVNGTSNGFRQVARVINSTAAEYAGTSYGATAQSTNTVLFFPAGQPIPIATRASRTASVDGSRKSLTVNLNTTLAANASLWVYNTVQVVNASPATKVVNRDRYVRINLANNAQGSTGPWCLGIPDIIRLKGVWIGANSSVSENDTSALNDFYVDHNQTESSYELGWLYKKPTSARQLSGSDWLLVKLDALTHSSNGVFTISSYPIDDSLPLANSVTTMNTLEIPEIYNDKGDYFDLRDYLDFRPVVSNTAALATNASSSTINPANSDYFWKFGADDDPTNNKKFPDPDSDITLTVENYMSRIDRVVLTSNGDFKVVTGGYDDWGQAAIPQAPSNSITLNIVDIPPYPSIPVALSGDMAKIIDTGVSNNRYLYKRAKDYKVVLTQSNNTFTQPEGYTMAEIGSLERRIESLEYNVALNAMEMAVKDMVIESSIDAAINRFKYGFFVDAFSNQNYSDIENPEYSATVVGGELTPRKDQFNIEYEYNLDDPTTRSLVHGGVYGSVLTLPYVEHNLVAQNDATDGPVVIPPAPDVKPPVYETQQATVCRLGVQRSGIFSTTAPATMEYNDFQFSVEGGAATVMFYTLEPNRFEVYQGYSQNFDVNAMNPVITSQNYVNLNTNEKTSFLSAIRNIPGSPAWIPDIQWAGSYLGYDMVSGGAGKLAWSHDPSRGNFYKIVVRKGSSSYMFNMCYPHDIIDLVEHVPTPPTPVPTVYRGAMTTTTPSFSLEAKYNEVVVQSPPQATVTLPFQSSGARPVSSSHASKGSNSRYVNK